MDQDVLTKFKKEIGSRVRTFVTHSIKLFLCIIRRITIIEISEGKEFELTSEVLTIEPKTFKQSSRSYSNDGDLFLLSDHEPLSF